MTDQDTEPTTKTDNDTVEDTSADETQDQNPADEQPKGDDASDNAEAGDDPEDNKGGDELPEWAKKKIAKVNSEAKGLRDRLKAAEDKLKNVKDIDEVKTLLTELESDSKKAERDLLVENVALKFHLPEKLAKRLSGNTREELEADAKDLAEFAKGNKEVRLEGGLDPRAKDQGKDETDPAKLAKKYSKRTRR